MSRASLAAIVAVRHLGGHRLALQFDDGVEGELGFSAHLGFEGVAAPLADPRYFSRVRIDSIGGLSWPNGMDSCPVWLHSLVTGEPMFRRMDPHRR
jgi:hypothetical protein